MTSRIEWTETTWNPVTGCAKVSPGCKNCYAERMAHRLQAMGVPAYRNGFQPALHEERLGDPLRWKKSRLVFVNSMSDLFHRSVSPDFLRNVIEVMRQASWHQFQTLTKRSKRLANIAQSFDWPANVWIGVSVETQHFMGRIDDLRRVPAPIRFLSLEPLLGPLPNLDLDGIDWVIVGGESGPRARPIEEDWVIDIRNQCLARGVPFFFKQWGGLNKKRNGRRLEGKIWSQWPLDFALASSVAD